MVKVFLALVLVAAIAVPLRAQSFFERDTNSTRLERIEYVLGATAAFSLFDYVSFNIAGHNFNTHYGHPALTIYHLILGAVGGAIDYFLYEKLGLSSAISFDLMWWTWLDDFGFYGWANVLNPSDWINRSGAYIPTDICCASWTPIGIMRKDNEYLPSGALIGQAFTGLAISLAILW